MTSEELTALMHAVPFVPFALCTDSGDFHVPTLDHLAHVPGTRAAAVAAADGTIEVVDLAAAYAETLEELARQDADDVAACEAALRDVAEHGSIPWEQVKAGWGP